MAVPSTWPREIAAAGGAYVPLSIFNDEPFVQKFTIKLFDYTGAAFEGGVRASFEESSPILKAFQFNPVLVGDDTEVTFGILDAIDVKVLRSAVDPGAIEQLFYNIKVTPVGGDKQTWLAGEFKVQGA